MDHDLLMMIYGVLLGAVSSIVTSLTTSIFQYWLERREYERRQIEEQDKQIRLIYLPTGEEVRIINSQQHYDDDKPEWPGKTIEAGSVVLSIVVCSVLAYQFYNHNLSLAFTVIPGFLVTKYIIKFLKPSKPK